jgi:hypothetical protein
MKNVIAFLASDDASLISGTLQNHKILVKGGERRNLSIYFIKQGKFTGLSFSHVALKRGKILTGFFPYGRVEKNPSSASPRPRKWTLAL